VKLDHVRMGTAHAFICSKERKVESPKKKFSTTILSLGANQSGICGWKTAHSFSGVSNQKGATREGIKKPNMPIPFIAIARAIITYMTSSSDPERATFGKNLSRKELNIVNTKRMKTAPINRDVEVISVTPVTISELEIQNETTGTIRLPTIIARIVIVSVLFFI
jgi:hypothetical protein